MESGQEDFQAVLRAAGETETSQENIQDWLQLDEGDPVFQLLAFLNILNKDSTVILYSFLNTTVTIKFSVNLFSNVFVF
jgi:hypothetical protein